MPNARPTLTPALTCKDVDKTYEYFVNTLGFAGHGRMPGPDGKTMHAEAVFPTRNGVALVMLSPYDATANNPERGDFARALKQSPETLGNGVGLFISVPDVDKYYAFVKAKGADIAQEPRDQFWGERDFVARTPDGYYLTFSSPIKGFRWPKEMLQSVSGAAKPTAPGASKSYRNPNAPPATRAKKR